MEAPSTKLAERYPSLAWWIGNQGWVEIGHDGIRPAFVRAVDEGGAYWEGARIYASLEEALAALDAGVQGLMEEVGLP